MEGQSKYNKNRWQVPHKRATKYAQDRKAKVHTKGPKEGMPLSDFESGIRSGYLQAQNDHTQLYWYKREKTEGKAAVAAIRAKKAAERAAKTAGKK